VFAGCSPKTLLTAIMLQWTSNGQQLLCQCGGSVKVLDIEQGRVTALIGVNEEEEDGEDIINTFLLSPDNEHIVSNHRSGLFKLWKWRGVFTFIYSLIFYFL